MEAPARQAAEPISLLIEMTVTQGRLTVCKSSSPGTASATPAAGNASTGLFVCSLCLLAHSLWAPCGLLVGPLWAPCGVPVGSLWALDTSKHLTRCGYLWSPDLVGAALRAQFSSIPPFPPKQKHLSLLSSSALPTRTPINFRFLVAPGTDTWSDQGHIHILSVDPRLRHLTAPPQLQIYLFLLGLSWGRLG